MVKLVVSEDDAILEGDENEAEPIVDNIAEEYDVMLLWNNQKVSSSDFTIFKLFVILTMSWQTSWIFIIHNIKYSVYKGKAKVRNLFISNWSEAAVWHDV